MSILDSFLSLILAVIAAILSDIWQFVMDYWPIILILVMIYFAPQIAVYLAQTSWAPTWLISLFEALAVVSPYLVAVVDAAWAGMLYLASTAWSVYTALGPWLQLAVALGAAYLLAPEETSDFVDDVVGVVSSGLGIVADIISGVTAPVIGPLLTLALAGAGLWIMASDDDDDQQEAIPDARTL
jgi:hypothetical protein